MQEFEVTNWPIRKWWISSETRGTGLVETTEWIPLIIKTTPSIWKKFVGQPLSNLTDGWLRHDGLKIEEIK